MRPQIAHPFPILDDLQDGLPVSSAGAVGLPSQVTDSVRGIRTRGVGGLEKAFEGVPVYGP